MVERPGWIGRPDPCGECLVVDSVAALVAEAPRDDAGVIAVALHHPGTSLEPGGPVGRVVAQTRVVGVTLDVGLVEDVEPELVAEVVERTVVGIVRRADGGDVVCAHLDQVGAHVVDADGLATVGVVVVAVDAEDPDRLTVDEQSAITNLDAPDTDVLHLGLTNVAETVDEIDDDGVAVRSLGAPGLGPSDVPSARRSESLEDVRSFRLVWDLLDHDAPDLASARIAECRPDRPSGLGCSTEVDHARGRDRAGPGGGVVADGDGHVGQMHIGSCLEPDRPVEAGHPPLILVLDVALRAVPHHDDRQLISAARRDMVRRRIRSADGCRCRTRRSGR